MFSTSATFFFSKRVTSFSEGSFLGEAGSLLGRGVGLFLGEAGSLLGRGVGLFLGEAGSLLGRGVGLFLGEAGSLLGRGVGLLFVTIPVLKSSADCLGMFFLSPNVPFGKFSDPLPNGYVYKASELADLYRLISPFDT